MTAPLSRQMPCPSCLHEGHWLACDRCACTTTPTPQTFDRTVDEEETPP